MRNLKTEAAAVERFSQLRILKTAAAAAAVECIFNENLEIQGFSMKIWIQLRDFQ